jgi:hypothetical protein
VGKIAAFLAAKRVIVELFIVLFSYEATWEAGDVKSPLGPENRLGQMTLGKKKKRGWNYRAGRAAHQNRAQRTARRSLDPERTFGSFMMRRIL